MEGHDDPDLTPQGLFESGAKRRVESVQFLEDYLAKKSRRKVKAFKKNYKRLENFAAYRESPKYYMIIVIDYLRRRALALGKQWVEAGRLDSADQVFDLLWDEFKQAEVDTSLDIRVLAKTNHDYFAQFNPNNDPPNIIDSRGFIPKLPPQPRKDNEIVGTPVSSGTVRGPVKVLRTSDEKPNRAWGHPGDQSDRPGLDDALHQCRGGASRNRWGAAAWGLGRPRDGKAMHRRD